MTVLAKPLGWHPVDGLCARACSARCLHGVLYCPRQLQSAQTRSAAKPASESKHHFITCCSLAQALLDAGYTLLDVRTELESNARGKIRGSICIPCANARQQFDAASGQMVRWGDGAAAVWMRAFGLLLRP